MKTLRKALMRLCPAALCLALLPGCSDRSVSPALECDLGEYSGITHTNWNGEVVGPVDPRDWGCVATAAAGAPAPSGPVGGGTTATCFHPAFPNPNPRGQAVRLTVGFPVPTRASLTVHARRRGLPSQVRTLVDRSFEAGLHAVLWDQRDDAGAPVPAGTYRMILRAAGVTMCGDVQIR